LLPQGSKLIWEQYLQLWYALDLVTTVHYAGRTQILGTLPAMLWSISPQRQIKKKSNNLFILDFTNAVPHAWLGMISKPKPIIFKEVQTAAFGRACQTTPESSVYHG
jgi:hypothetical protein